MRRLATLDPKYTENIAFYLVGSDPTQTVAVLEQDRQKQGYPWSVAGIGSSGLRDLHILQQSTKIAIDGNAGWALGDNLMAGLPIGMALAGVIWISGVRLWNTWQATEARRRALGRCKMSSPPARTLMKCQQFSLDTQ